MILRQRKWKSASGSYNIPGQTQTLCPVDDLWLCSTQTNSEGPENSEVQFVQQRHTCLLLAPLWTFDISLGILPLPVRAHSLSLLFQAVTCAAGAEGCRRIRHVTDQCHEDRLHLIENDRRSFEAQRLCRLQMVVSARSLEKVAMHNTVFSHVFSLASVECGGRAGTAQLCILRRVTSFTVSCQLAVAAAATCPGCLGSGRSVKWCAGGPKQEYLHSNVSNVSP